MRKYYYIDDTSKQQCGPFTLQELPSRNISRDTMVWSAGMRDWTKAGNVEELTYLFNSKAPVLQEQQNRPQPTNYPPQNAPNGYNQQAGYRNQNQGKWSDILPMPKNWLIESIVFSIFCCSPISVVGIFYASKVESLYYAKEYEASVRAANRAKNWSLAGILFLPACYTLFIIFAAFIGIFA